MSAVMAGFASDVSAIRGLSKQVLRDFTISFRKPKIELLTLWVVFPPLSYLNFGSVKNTLRHLQMNLVR